MLDIPRHDRDYAPVDDRIRHFKEFIQPLPDPEVRQQAARGMDGGIPFGQDLPKRKVVGRGSKQLGKGA